MASPALRLALVIGHATFATAQQMSNDTSATPMCSAPYSKDLYGLGIRMGYYFNWVAGWIANNFAPDEIAGTQDSNAVFLLGVLASLLRGTSTRVLTRLDGMILMELAIGTLWSVVSLWGYRTCAHRGDNKRTHGIALFGGFGTHLRLLLSVMLASYSVWFFAIGVSAHRPGHLRPSANGLECYALFIFGLPLTSRVRACGLVLSTLSLAYCTPMLVASAIAGITRIWKAKRLIDKQEYLASSRLRYVSGFSNRYLESISSCLSIFNLLWIAFSVVLVEATIRENNIAMVEYHRLDDLLTPAQLLPILIGVCSFARNIYYAYKYSRVREGSIRPSLGFDHTTHSGIPIPRPQSIAGTNRWWVKFLSSRLAPPQTKCCEEREKKNEDAVRNENVKNINTIRENWSWTQKAMNAWLPWMSIFSFWPWQNNTLTQRIEGLEHTQTTNTDRENNLK